MNLIGRDPGRQQRSDQGTGWRGAHENTANLLSWQEVTARGGDEGTTGRQRAFESNPDKRGESGSDRTSGFACRLWLNRFWAEPPTARQELVVQLHRPLDQRVLMVEDLGFLRAIGIQQDQDGRTPFLGEADADELRWRGPHVREPQYYSSYRLVRIRPAIGVLNKRCEGVLRRSIVRVFPSSAQGECTHFRGTVGVDWAHLLRVE